MSGQITSLRRSAEFRAVSARTHRLTAGLLALIAFVGLAGEASAGRPRGPAQCSTVSATARLAAHLDELATCINQRLEFGSTWSCGWLAPPPCSAEVSSDILQLARGSLRSGDPIAPSAQLACQQALVTGATGYVSENLSQRAAGLDREAAHQAALAVLTADLATCDGVPVLDGLPEVGPQCSAALDATVDESALAGCMGTLERVWSERIAADPQPLRPNILFILTDDQRWDTLDATHGIGGAPVMPNVLNTLAAEGVSFSHAYATTPLCGPSRASILLGQLASTHLIRAGKFPPDGAPAFPDASTLATWMSDAGYRTGMFGKYMNSYRRLWGTDEPGYVPPGWDVWRAFKYPGYFDYELIESDGGPIQDVSYGSAEADYSTDVLRDRALTFIDESVGDGEPFFLYWAPMAPHLPEIPAPRHLGAYAGVAPFRPASFQEPDVSDKPPWVAKIAGYSDAEFDLWRVAQLEMLQAVDEAVAAFVARLASHGILDDTLIVYTSDNGYFWGEHRLVAKNREYLEAIRIPLIVRYPPLAPLPRTDDSKIANIDFASTFATLAGATPGVLQDGRSFDRVIDGTEKNWRAEVLTEAWPPGNQFATINEGHFQYTEGSTGERPVPSVRWTEFYDLANDPLELENAVDDPAYATMIQEMSEQIRMIRPNWPADAKVE